MDRTQANPREQAGSISGKLLIEDGLDRPDEQAPSGLAPSPLKEGERVRVRGSRSRGTPSPASSPPPEGERKVFLGLPDRS
jgi:hypothetical protein